MHVTIASNPVLSRVIDADRELKLELSELLSFNVAGAEHQDSFKGGSWSGRSSLFGFDRGTFPSGMLSMVITYLKRKGHQIRLARAPAPAPLGPERPIVNKFGFSEDYAYQWETTEQLLKHRQMVAQVATGGGKSNIAAIAFARIKRPTLFLTTRSVLMHQMARSLQESLDFRAAHGEPELASAKVGILGDNIMEPRRLINCAMVQTIAGRLKSKDPTRRAKMIKFLEHHEFLIPEEAHEAAGEQFYEITQHCKNAHYRLALTATPFMKDDEEANMRLMACSGHVGIRVTELELIQKGILATPEFKILNAPHHPLVRASSNWQRAYTYGIVQNEGRNLMIASEVGAGASAGLSSMVLVQRKEHGNILEELFRSRGIRSRFIFGDSDQAERDAALRALKTGELQCLIGSTILDVGVDVPAVGMVALAGGGKAEVAMRQRIGRGLRRKAPGFLNRTYILDFHDGKNKHLVKHSNQRRHIIESTPGFAEGILARGQGFYFTRHGIKEAA